MLNNDEMQRQAGMQTLGRYQLLRRIGKGGMGDVWLANDPRLNRQVAIKTLPPQAQEDREFSMRFEREAQAAAALNHPHILPVHDYGEQTLPDGRVVTYIVMPHVSGGSLADKINEYKSNNKMMPAEEAISYLKQAAEAIDYAHSQGIVHRDIKPGNMLLRPDGWLLLADFGIARILSGVENLTQAGVGFGTPEYMAPEQAQGKAEAASDNYSLAVLAYQLFTGKVPFQGDTSYATTIQHMTLPPPPPQQVNPHISIVLSNALLQGLAKQPSERPATAQLLTGELQRALNSAPFEGTFVTPVQAPPPPPLNPYEGTPSGSQYLSASGSVYPTTPGNQYGVPANNQYAPPPPPPPSQYGMQYPQSNSGPYGTPVSGGQMPYQTAGTYPAGGNIGKKSMSRRQVLVASGIGLVAIGGTAFAAWAMTHNTHTTTSLGGNKSSTPAANGTSTGSDATPQANSTQSANAAGAPILIQGKHDKAVATLAWSPAGNILASAGAEEEHQVFLWDADKLQQGQNLQEKASHDFQYNVTDMVMAWSQDGGMLAIGNAGLGDMNSAPIAVFKGDLSDYAPGFDDKFGIKGTTSVEGICWGPGQYIYAVIHPFDLNGKIDLNAQDQLFLIDPKQPQATIKPMEINQLFESADDNFVDGGNSNYIHVASNPLVPAPGNPTRLAMATTNGILVGDVLPNGTTPKWNKWRLIKFDQNDDYAQADTGSLSWSSSGKLLAAIKYNLSKPTSFLVFDLSNMEYQDQTIPQDANDTITIIAWNPAPSSNLIAGGGQSGKVYIWNYGGNKMPVNTLDVPSGVKGIVKSLAWSADGTYLAAAYSDSSHSIAIWKMK